MENKGPATMLDIAHSRGGGAVYVPSTGAPPNVNLRNIELLLREVVEAIKQVRFVVNVPQAATPDVILPKDAIRLTAELDSVADALMTMKPSVTVEAPPAATVNVHSPKYAVFLHIIIVLLLADVALRVAEMLH